MDTWRPVSTAYGACSNTESSNQWAGAVSATGNESSAGAFIGKHRWISVIRSWFWAGSGARRRRGVRRWAWPYLDGGIDGDLALLLAVRSQHDGIDWDRLADPPGLSQSAGLSQPAGPSQAAGPSDPPGLSQAIGPSQATGPSQPLGPSEPPGPSQPPGLSQLAAHSAPAARAPAARGQHPRVRYARGQYEGIDWDCARDPGERVP